jgi:nuclear transcription Y subunit beta
LTQSLSVCQIYLSGVNIFNKYTVSKYVKQMDAMQNNNTDEVGGQNLNMDELQQGGAQGREQDRFLPIANISRIMKRSLPKNAKIAKDAKDVVQECVSEFISFITSEASDKCQREKRKTINGDDLLWAMDVLFFKEYLEPLNLYLQKFRDAEKRALDKSASGVGGDVEK